MGGGLIFEYAISLEYKPPPPPPKVLRDRYVHFQSSCLHKNTVTKNSGNTVGHVPRVMYHGKFPESAGTSPAQGWQRDDLYRQW